MKTLSRTKIIWFVLYQSWSQSFKGGTRWLIWSGPHKTQKEAKGSRDRDSTTSSGTRIVRATYQEPSR